MQISRLFQKSVVSISMVLASVAANAAMITFDSLEQPGCGVVSCFTNMASYSEAGFTFTSNFTDDLAFASAMQGTTGVWYAGSAGLFNNYGAFGGVTTLTMDGGGPFDVLSIDLAPLSTHFPGPYTAGPTTVSFIGNIHGSGTVTQSFTTLSSLAFSNFTFSGFTNLDSLVWSQDSPWHQFDNVSVTASIPEPETYAMLLAGLGLLGFAARRRKLKTAA